MTTSNDVREVDVAVVGLGPGGLRVSTLLAEAGLDVVGIEAGLVGGECRFFGCTPSKMLVRAAELAQEARRAEPMIGARVDDPDWTPVARRIAVDGTNGWNDSDTVAAITETGVGVVRGRGRLLGDGLVAVGAETVHARRGVVVATGTVPATPPIDGLGHTPYLTNRDVFGLDRLPNSLLCVGGGPIGVEISQAMSRLGVAVTLVESELRILGSEEPEVSALLADVMRDEGVRVVEGGSIDRVKKTAGGVRADADAGADADGDGEAYEAEQLLIASGREACVDDLGLDAAGVCVRDGVIVVDDRLRAARAVWAVGDVTGKGPYTHVAKYQAEIAAADILDQPRAGGADYHAVPRLVFTAPEIAAVGLTESAARDQGIRVQSACVGIDASSRAWLHDSDCVGLVKLVADADTRLLCGATVVAPQAAEMIGQLTLALHARLSLECLGSMIHAFPTFHDAALAAVRQLVATGV
jgi:pyruvate/2-oxoglutarate dehydrogenase complex dihydrolipoamide dehydrogenase (E3) component